MLFTFGRVMGWVILSFYVLAASNYVLKLLNRRWISKMPKESNFRKNYMKVLRFFVKAHPWLGYLAFLSVLIHLIVQFSFYGVYPSGFLAGGLMLAQISVGSYGQWFRKKKRGEWLILHRLLTVLLLLVVAFHIYSALS